MARGWESKSVEEQQAQHAEPQGTLRQKLTPNELAKQHLRDGLVLSRQRIAHQLHDAESPQRRAMLESGALSHLDAEIEDRLGDPQFRATESLNSRVTAVPHFSFPTDV